PYLLEVDHLLGPGGVAEAVEATPLDKTPFHLNPKCDGCLYNGICFTESADREDVSLVPYITSAEKRALAEAGVTTLGDLVAVKALPGPKEYGRTFPPGEGKEALAARLAADPIVGPGIDRLNERARRLVAHLRRGAPFYSWLLHSGQSTLPSPQKYPDLVQVFLDAQHDFLEDRLYQVSALVTGPRGEFPVVLLTEGAPDDVAERELLATFVSRVYDAVVKAGGGTSPRLHFYVYDPRDQRVLLEALRRHLDHLLGAPALYDLLTSPTALGQPLVSFLAHEVRERTNLPLTCANLTTTASWLWVDDKNFSWEHKGEDYRRKFRAKLFDGHRTLVREANGRLRPPRADEELKGPNRARIEGASRFGSQVPLEYAYAVWGRLPRSLEWDDKVFRGVTRDDLVTFGFLRVKALQHIARSFKFTNDRLEKEPIQLSAEAIEAASRTPPLTRVLTEFLHFEHHAHEQELLAHYALPAGKRAATGRTLLARVVRENGRDVALIADSREALQRCRLKEGDWVVVNPVENPDLPDSPGRIACGMLARIVQLAHDRVLLNKAFAGAPTAFKRAHINFPLKTNLLVSLDEMVDDLNADKILEALQHAQGNPLHRLLIEGPYTRPAAEAAKAAAERFAAAVDALEAPRVPTPPQRRFSTDTLDGPLHLLQGPPGTGKSHTTGWAVLTRAVAAHAEGRMFRAVVTAKTHSAIRVLLESIAKKRGKFTAAHPDSILRHLLIAKMGEGDDDLPAGVFPLNPYDRPERVGPTLGAPAVVVGATPGGLYSLLKRHLGQVPWTEPLFDLVVIDEASQMGIPEALLACAFLKPDGQILVVGDHRQMPPILAHAWDSEARRSALDVRPYLSIFEHLYEKGFPRVGLDESFRMHRDQARFLAEHIYRKDGLQFFSRRTDLLPPVASEDPFVQAVLDPQYPVVVIEHDEEASTQLNLTEAALLGPLLDALKAA
ncbi:MAG TPA: AAA family ATPase, partial [Candidatus Thermoplasmatota archaeon]|nr:AAA family ATPase [Candidatus Thermoplasmatota archaeon]